MGWWEGSLVKQLALLSSDLVALTSEARGAFHDSSSWTSRTHIASLLIWARRRGIPLGGSRLGQRRSALFL